MITQKRKFYYQPQLLTSIICWSWTIIILLVGIIIWLEITTFQTTTLMFIIAFVFLTWIQIHFRKFIITKNKIRVISVLHPRGKVFNKKLISHVIFKRNSISVQIHDKHYKYLVPANSAIELSEIFANKEG
ncbi:EbsA family protein [Fructilactobacillus sp. Tb1]|uniref:EbsA family protein n=1 Tax=Fructilactobacillus sp. Tb1 TaxID=3422304 RepID=UPI003D2DF9E2